MGVSQTSKEAYYDILYSGLANDQELKILKFLHRKKKPQTRRQIGVGCRIDLGSSAGRINKMMDILVEADLDVKCKSTGKIVGTVKIKE